jgi:hypothetical protein
MTEYKEYISQKFKEIEHTLEYSENKQFLFRSFFNEYAEPVEFFKSFLEREHNLSKVLACIFPYSTKYVSYCSKTNVGNFITDTNDIWLIWQSNVLFRDKNDSDAFETLLKLLT